MTDVDRPGDGAAPRLVLGPLLRYVGEHEATIWVETDRACQVEILGHQARTFEVAGHHYALVIIAGLRPGTEYEYQVALDGTVRWPEPDSDFPPSVLRTTDPARTLRLTYGSCRVAELPETIHGIIAARLDLLSDPEKRLLQDAAVVGKVFCDLEAQHLCVPFGAALDVSGSYREMGKSHEVRRSRHRPSSLPPTIERQLLDVK